MQTAVLRRPSDAPNPVLADIDGLRARSARLRDMTASLVDMFGPAALSIARSQPGASDVGGNSGIRWRDVAAVLSDTVVCRPP